MNQYSELKKYNMGEIIVQIELTFIISVKNINAFFRLIQAKVLC